MYRSLSDHHIIRALVGRAFGGTFSDRGRLVDLLLVPVSFLITWGLLLRSNLIPRDIGVDLLVTNLIWAVAASIQIQGNRTMMFDLWAKEFCELFRSGVSHRSYLVALLLVGAISGIANLLVFLLLVPLLFGATSGEVAPLVASGPIYLLASLGLMGFVGGLILRWGQTYGFLSWTALQFVMIFSSPYAPVDSLPPVLRLISHISPYAAAFEFVRFGAIEQYVAGLSIGILWLIAGAVFFDRMFIRARRTGKLVTL